MKLTSLGELAHKAMLELAKTDAAGEPWMSARDIAFRCRASPKFLEQALLQLREAGLIKSRRGLHGGYRLGRDSREIYLGDISRVIDGPLAPAPCASVTQHRTCDWCENEAECELKSVWVEVRDVTAQVMDSISLAELVRRAWTKPPASAYLI